MGDEPLFDDRPAWARRIKAERAARRWSQSEAVAALRANSSAPLPSDESLVRNWKRWEAGSAEPDEFYKPLIAKTFGTVTAAFLPMPYKRSLDSELLNGTGLDALEVISRLRASDVSTATLDALRIAADPSRGLSVVIFTSGCLGQAGRRSRITSSSADWTSPAETFANLMVSAAWRNAVTHPPGMPRIGRINCQSLKKTAMITAPTGSVPARVGLQTAGFAFKGHRWLGHIAGQLGTDNRG